MQKASTYHSIENPLIFVIEEKRRSLKEELKGTSGKQLAKLSDNEKFDYRTAKILAYSGDSMPVDPEVYKEVHTLIHECTFLQLKDRKYPIHSEIQEVFDLAKSANVQNLILCHISPRYPNSKIRDLIEKTKTHGINYSWIIPGKVNEIE